MAELSEFERHTATQLGSIAPDWFLRLLVKMANDRDISVGITLLVGGSMVTGRIISGRDYFTRLGEEFGRAIGVSDEQGSAMFEGFKAFYPKASDEDEATSGGPENSQTSDDGAEDVNQPPEPAYVHLDNCRVYQGITQIPERYAGNLWRGRLSRVDGFIVGELNREIR